MLGKIALVIGCNNYPGFKDLKYVTVMQKNLRKVKIRTSELKYVILPRILVSECSP